MFTACDKPNLTPTYEQTEGEYVLNISVSDTSFKKGEDIEVEMVFENLSGQEQSIDHGLPLVRTYIVGHEDYNPNYTIQATWSTLVQGATASTITRGSEIARGTYELVATAEFSIREGDEWLMTEEIEVVSNTIFITVNSFWDF